MGNYTTIFLDMWKRMKVLMIVVGILLGISTYLGMINSTPITSNFSIGLILVIFAIYTFDIRKVLKNAAIVNKYFLYTPAKNADETIKNATLGNISTNTYFILGTLYLFNVVINRLEFANLTRFTYVIGDFLYLGAILYFVQAKRYLNKYINLAIEDSTEDIKNKLFKGGKDD